MSKELIHEEDWEVKDPFSGSWFPFRIRAYMLDDGSLEVSPQDYFRNGAVFVRKESQSGEPFSMVEKE